MIKSIQFFGWLILLCPSLMLAQSLDRMVIGSAGECATVVGQTYAIFIGEAVVGTEQATLPSLTMGFQQPRELILLGPQFISFSGQLEEDSKVALEWEFASHPQSQLFQLYRSLDGDNFDPVGSREPQNFASRYSFLDERLPRGYTGKLTYQVKWLGKNGERVLSPRIELWMGNEGLPIRVFPNPFSQRLTVDNPYPERQLQLRLLDVRGRVCWQGKMKGQIDIPTQSLAKGMYQLHLSGEGTNESHKVIKK